MLLVFLFYVFNDYYIYKRKMIYLWIIKEYFDILLLTKISDYAILGRFL